MTDHGPEPVAATSADVLADTLDALRDAIPQAFTEGKVDFAKLREVLGDAVDDRPERYSFTWAGKRDAIRMVQTPSQATLKPDRAQSVDFDATQNLFIEGDSLEVLKLLYKAYFGKIKLIYIDPPYNIGTDRIYVDDYRDPLGAYLRLTAQEDGNGNLLTSNPETNGRHHSTWLSMMYPRLFLARQLLRDDGLIFVSIDDTEAANLRLLMNEVFGEENFVGVLKRRAARKTALLSHTMSDMCDYVVAYSRARLTSPLSVTTVSDDTRPVFNEGNKVTERIIPAGTPARCPDARYPQGTHGVRTVSFELLDDVVVKNGHTFAPARVLGPFRVNQDLLAETLFITRNFGLRRTVLPAEKEAPKAMNDLVDEPRFYNEIGSEEITALFGQPIFDNPKPAPLIEHLCTAASVGDKEFTILDFFAGSATTAQAVLDLNRKDGGTRRFIMVQLPERTPTDSQARSAGYATIAELGKERIRRVIARLKEPAKGNGAPTLPLETRDTPEDLGFRAFALAPSNLRQRQPLPDDAGPDVLVSQLEMFVDPLVEGWTPEDVIYEVALKEGYALTCRIEALPPLSPPSSGGQGGAAHRVHRVTDEEKEQSFLICLDDSFDLETARALNLGRDDLFICRNAALDDTLAANLALQCRLKTI